MGLLGLGSRDLKNLTKTEFLAIQRVLAAIKLSSLKSSVSSKLNQQFDFFWEILFWKNKIKIIEVARKPNFEVDVAAVVKAVRDKWKFSNVDCSDFI